MRIDSGHVSAMHYGAFGQQGMHSGQSREIEEKNRLPSAATHQVAEKMKSVETSLSTGTAAKEQQALTYSHAVKAPSGFGAAGMAYSSITGTGTSAPLPGTAAKKEDNPALEGMPFAKEAEETEVILPGQAAATEETAADEAGETEETAKSGTHKAGDAEKAAQDDPALKTEVARLKQREQEVIAHEAAHKAVGGQYASAASYTYTTGPDNKRYIDGGEVSIRTPSTKDPEEALRMAELIKRAALAPANPSSQDRSVAASATQKAANARAEIAKAASEEAAAKRAEAQEAKEEKDEKAESGSTGAASSSGSKGGKKPSGGADLSGSSAARGQKAADAYAWLSGSHSHSGSSGTLHAVG